MVRRMRPSFRLLLIVAAMALCAATVYWLMNRMRTSSSLDKRVETYRQRAQRGDSSAEEALGELYSQGKGVPQDYNLAFQLFTKSADQGNAQAQYNIGRMYEVGRGVAEDYSQAIYWYRKAADLGNSDAECSIGTLYFYGRGVQLDLKEAASWYHRAADRGFARAEYDLGTLYASGRGVPKDPDEAYRWYRKAADQGYKSAEQVLGFKKRMSGPGSLFPIAMLLGCMWILKGARLVSTIDQNRKIAPHHLAALLGLVYSVLGLYRIVATVHSVLLVDIYCFIEYLFLGGSLAVAFHLLSQSRMNTRLSLGIALALFLGMNWLVVARGAVEPYSELCREVCSVDGMLAGVILCAVASLMIKWIESTKGDYAEDDSQDTRHL